MQEDVNRLIKLVAANGYEVKFATSNGVSIINILHRVTNRETVFGFDALSKHDVMRCINERFCTERQAILLAEARESGFHSPDSMDG